MLTTGRQDFGILRSSVLLLRSDGRFDLRLWAGGMHLDRRYGRTVDGLRADGFEVHREIAFTGARDDIACETAAALEAVGEALREETPDALLLLGDRTETVAAALAATVRRVPIAHLHGGEETEGAIDNLCRHAITKLSHLHLVSHETHARRVLQLGEPSAAVVVVGAAGLDNLYRSDLPTDEELAELLGGTLAAPLVLVTLHPTTLGASADDEVAAVGEAMEGLEARIVITAPNSDSGGADIMRYWQRWVSGRSNVILLEALGDRAYWGLLSRAHVVLGNSSGGLIEAPAAGAAVINVGDRQKGRVRYGVVYDVLSSSASVRAALDEALATDRPGPPRDQFYPRGPAAPRIVDALARWDRGSGARKAFVDLDCR